MIPIHLICAFVLTEGLVKAEPLPPAGLFTSSTALVVNKVVEEPVAPQFCQIRAAVTGYTPKDSCHLSKSNPKCLMASGRSVYEGAVACPRSLKLGTYVEINGRVYVCEDRYATWLDAKRGMPTFDIFSFSNPHPKTVEEVKIILNQS
jgi:hypothetical protein